MVLETDDRMLLVGQHPVSEVRALAGRLTSGSLILLVPVDAVPQLRRDLRDVVNVMVIAAEEDGSVPFVDEYFSVVCATDGQVRGEELQRVLMSGGKRFDFAADTTNPKL